MSYPVSKAAATTACLGLARELGLRLQVLRIFQVFGEGETATRFWPSLRTAALEGRDFAMSAGVQVRDFIPVEEVAQQFLAALAFDGVEPGHPHIKNIGTGHPQSLLDFAQFWWSHWQAKGKLIPGQINNKRDELSSLVADIKNCHIM